MSIENIYYPKSFFLSKNDYKVLFFDIFFKNKFIYLISPIYTEPYCEKNIVITFNNENLIFSDKIIRNDGEPISIYKYNIITDETKINIQVKYVDLTMGYYLEKIEEPKKYLTLNTLFKDDFKLINIFYDYYIKQGVEHFYLYYNGELNEKFNEKLKGDLNGDLNIFFNNNNITLVEWNFKYFNNPNCKYIHHAQLGSLNHCFYKYGKDYSKYMIFNDLDEYLHIKNETILNTLKKNDYDWIQFNNIWSSTLDNMVPNKFPAKFKIDNVKHPYPIRAKNIYKCECVELVNIHTCLNFNKINLKILEDLDMYHFYNWSGKTGRELRVENYTEIQIENFDEI